MKCLNSAFNAQGSRVIIYSSCTGSRSSENICSSSSGGAQEKGNTGWNSLSLPPKLVEKKLVWVPVISCCKIFIPSYAFDALLVCRNWPFSPP